MSTRAAHLHAVLGSSRFWRIGLRLALWAALALAVLVAVFTAFLVLLPIAVLGGAMLHFHLRRRLRRAAAPRPGRRDQRVIEGEYTIVDR